MNELIAQIPKALNDIVRQEEFYLSHHFSKGIFDIPEIALSYILAKELGKVGKMYYGKSFYWNKEESVGNSGPTDLVLHKSHDLIFIELKIASTIDAYLKDVEKLRGYKGKGAHKIFITLVDTWKGKETSDPRIEKMRDAPVQPLMDPFEHFATKHPSLQGDVSCVIGVWKIIS